MEPAIRRMTADAFLDWARDEPRGRFELAAGEVVAMAPERAAHALLKAELWLAFRTAIAREGLPCQAVPDGMAVRIDDVTVYEPDVLVRCGARLDPDAIEVRDPVVLVEVVSPSSRAIDAGAKLEDYFRLPSVRHYLIARTTRRSLIHHAREADGAIVTRIVAGGVLTLAPPGLSIDVDAVFAAL